MGFSQIPMCKTLHRRHDIMCNMLSIIYGKLISLANCESTTVSSNF